MKEENFKIPNTDEEEIIVNLKEENFKIPNTDEEEIVVKNGSSKTNWPS